jgi:hypothetical protein
MQLKSFGCSFIYGSELTDASAIKVIPSNSTWPAHLAGHLNYNYKCYAKPGAGNLQILEQILNQASNKNEYDLFVIGWTWIDRFDHYNADRIGEIWKDWSTIMPVDTDALAKTYYRDLHSEYQDKFTCLSYIKLAIDTLNQKEIPFIMTYIDGLLFDQQWNTTPAVLDLQEYVKPHMTTFNGKSFLEWSRTNNYSISNAWHPLEEAHLAAADYMIKVFDTQNITDPTR